MLEIFLIIAPVFLIILFGYTACATGYLSKAVSDQINALSIKCTLPVLLFWAMYNLDFSVAIDGPMLVGFYTGSLLSFLLAMAMARVIWKRPPGESVAVGFCAFFTNSVLLGLPIAQRAFDDEVVALAYGIIAFHSTLIYSVGMMSMEFARRDGKSLGETLLAVVNAIIRNPLMIGVILGVLTNLSGIKLFEPITVAVRMIAEAALPIAVLGIGVAMSRYQLKAELRESLAISTVILLFYPAVVYLLTQHLFGLPAKYVQAAVTIAATPAGLNIYIFAAMYNRAMSTAASVIVISTILSVVTMSAWLALLHTL